jgi:hypothetical protein
MSQSPPEIPSTSYYQVIFHNALEAYKKRTGKDLESDPLLDRLKSCDFPDAVLAVLREQIPRFDQSGSNDEGFTKWLSPIVTVLCTFSSTIGGAVGLVSLSQIRVIHPRFAL